MNLIIGLSLAVVVLGNGILLGRAIERRRVPKRASLFDAVRPSFEDELQAYLKRHNFVLTTREMAAMAWPIIESPHVSRGKAVFMNPDDLADLTRRAGPEMIRAFQEWGDRHRYTSPFLTQCAHRWGKEYDCPHEHPGHKCRLSVVMHGPKCVCQCGATAAYVEQPDGTIDKTLEEPKDDGS